MPSAEHLSYLRFQRGMSCREIAETLNLNADSVRSRTNRHIAKQRTSDAPPPDKIVPLMPHSDIQREQPFDMADLSDRDRWSADLAALLKRKDFVTVMHPCDRHEPFVDRDIDNATYELMRLLRPDVVVRGSDEDDNPQISVFYEENEPRPDAEDFLELMEINRRYHTRRTQESSPSALQVNIEGNHGWTARFRRWLYKAAKAGKKTLLRKYIDNIRCGGAVAYIGMKQSVRIGPSLVVMHGWKYGDNAAQQTLALRRYSVSILAGHAHRPSLFSTVSHQAVTGLVSGCLCQVPQHYQMLEDDNYVQAQHGTAYATICAHTGQVDLKHIAFYKTEAEVWFEWGGRIYTVPRVNVREIAA